MKCLSDTHRTIDRKEQSIKMRILVVNDDGIDAVGIVRLAKAAKELGEVWVVAPAAQCSAMPQRITVRDTLTVKPADFPIDGVKAYSVSGTPADCVKVALMELLPQKPDIVFSGINEGYNAGHDILYSGTIGAATEALSNGIPAIAFSTEANDVYDVTDAYLLPIAAELLDKKLPANVMWNVNFPGCCLSEYKGILWDRVPANHQFYSDNYNRQDKADGSFVLTVCGIPVAQAEEGTDIKAVLDRYISIGTISNAVITKEHRG